MRHTASAEDWTRPEGRQLTLRIMVSPQSDHWDSREPLFILKGGPGERASADGRRYVQIPFQLPTVTGLAAAVADGDEQPAVMSTRRYRVIAHRHHARALSSGCGSVLWS
jgi:hypothetical protein